MRERVSDGLVSTIPVPVLLQDIGPDEFLVETAVQGCSMLQVLGSERSSSKQLAWVPSLATDWLPQLSGRMPSPTEAEQEQLMDLLESTATIY